MRVSIVTVTYGNRADYVKQLVGAGFAAGACEIFVLDNGSPLKNSEKLEAIVADRKGVFLHRSETNLGSAGGFGKALLWARLNATSDFLWILDDDNLPENGALNALVLAYRYLGNSDSNILVSYRMLLDKVTKKVVHKRELLDSVTRGVVIGDKSSVFSKVLKRLGKIVARPCEFVNYPIVLRSRASWGGLFFCKTILDDIGYPNEDFYLYGDDFEFSDRLICSGKKIFTVYESKIIDIDAQQNSAGFFSESQPEIKVYYSLRNHVFLDYHGKFMSCAVLALGIILNGVMESGVRGIFYRRVPLILKAIAHGYAGRLGKVSDFEADL